MRRLLPYLMPMGVGLALLAGALISLVPTARFVFRAERTQARFIGAIEHSGGSHGGRFLYPRFRFTTRNGTVVSVTEHSGSTDQPYADGDTVAFLYDPNDPTRAERDSIMLWRTPLILAAIGLPFTLIPAAVFVMTRRRRAGHGAVLPTKPRVGQGGR